MSWITGWRRRVSLVGALALVGAAAVVLPTTFAAGDLGTGDSLGVAGILRLHLDSDADYFRYEPDGGSPTTSNITTTGCSASVAGGLVSVTVTPTTAVLGNADDSLGAKSNGEGNGQKCGQVNGASQSIKIALAGALADKSIDRAELDIGFKFNVIVLAELRSNGTLVGTETLSGTGSDSGNDAGASDNGRFEIGEDGSVLFDEITLKLASNSPANGAFGLEGGHDGTLAGPIGVSLNTKDSIFRISNAEGVLDCGGTATETGSTGEPDATLERLSNSDCKKVPYNLESSSDADSQDVHFGKDISEQQDASFLLDVDWDNEAAQYPLPGTQVDEGSGPYTPAWCDGTFASPSLPAGSTVHWCVRKETAESAGAGQVHRKTYYYGTGDPKFTLPGGLGG